MPLRTEVDLSPGNFVLDGEFGDQAPFPKKAEPFFPIFGPCLLWPNGWMDQDGTWHGGGSWSGPHCVRWYPAPLPKKGAEPPIFDPRLLWPNGCMDQDALGREVGLDLRDIVLDGDPALPSLKGHSPQFSANVRCGQTD